MINPAVLNEKSKKKKRDGSGSRTPLHLPLKPEHHDIENHKKKKKKSSNDYVINVNDEFIVDFDIEKKTIMEKLWALKIK